MNYFLHSPSAQDAMADHWLVPVVQGYVQMETCLMDFEEDKSMSDMSSSGEFSPSSGPKLDPLSYNISIVSRRSCHRAGRYLLSLWVDIYTNAKYSINDQYTSLPVFTQCGVHPLYFKVVYKRLINLIDGSMQEVDIFTFAMKEICTSWTKSSLSYFLLSLL